MNESLNILFYVYLIFIYFIALNNHNHFKHKKIIIIPKIKVDLKYRCFLVNSFFFNIIIIIISS
jgi:hypothetical protein